MIQYHRFIVNLIGVNSYLVWDEQNLACLIDPGFSNPSEELELSRFLEDYQLQLTKCVCTHLHFDHIWGAQYVSRSYGIPIEVPEYELSSIPSFQNQLLAFSLPYKGVKSSYSTCPLPDTIHFGSTELEVLSTPGHSPGHVCFYNQRHGILFSGDVLFKSGYGRYDLWGGDYNTLMSSIQKLLALPPTTKVLPGHGDETTIGAEMLNF